MKRIRNYLSSEDARQRLSFTSQIDSRGYFKVMFQPFYLEIDYSPEHLPPTQPSSPLLLQPPKKSPFNRKVRKRFFSPPGVDWWASVHGEISGCVFLLFSSCRREHHECLFKLIGTDTDINQFKESICKKQSKTLRKALRVLNERMRRGKFFLIFRLFCSWIFNRLCLFYLTAPIKSIEILMRERILRSASKTIRVCRRGKGISHPWRY